MAIYNISDIKAVSSGDGESFTGTNHSVDADIAPDNNRVVFTTANTSLYPTGTGFHILMKDLTSGAFFHIDTSTGGLVGANSQSFNPIFSADGSKVMFVSLANNLVTGDTNNNYDVFIKDVLTGTTTRVSTNSSGGSVFGANISPRFNDSGTKVIFASDATDVIAGDTNGNFDIFIKDLATGSVTRVSTTSTGAQATGGASTLGNGTDPTAVAGHNSGRYFTSDDSKVVFYSSATNLVSGDTNGRTDVFVKNIVDGSIVRASTSSTGVQGNGNSRYAEISADGTKVLFQSQATNFVANDTNGADDIFVKDLTTGAITLVSHGVNGNVGLGSATGSTSVSQGAVFSPDATKVLFSSLARLVTEDTDNFSDIYLKDLVSGEMQLMSRNLAGDKLNGHSTNANWSPDGKSITFETTATNHGFTDINGAVKDVLIYYLEAPCIFGDANGNTYTGDEGTNCYHGMGGNDTIYGMGDSDTLRGDEGNDLVYGGNQNDLIYGGADQDMLYGELGNDTIYGDTGNDSLYGDAGNDVMDGGAGIDKLFGGDDNDTIYGGDGSDSIDGGNGSNLLDGGSGNDTIVGSDGMNTIIGGNGNDKITGGETNDLIDAGNHNDTINAGAGDDSVDAGGNDDFVTGGLGNDTIQAGTGNDSVTGDDGDDLMYGHNGTDSLDGGIGNDTIYAGNDNDLIIGGAGNDYMRGMAGNDTLIGNEGIDDMFGDEGADTFVFKTIGDSTVGGWIERDTIVDFEVGVDKIDLTALGYMTYIGTSGFTGSGPELRHQASLEPGTDHIIVSIDIDGDRNADMMFNLRGNVAVSEGDFLLGSLV